MPELPDVVVYLQRMRALLGGATLNRVRIANPFVLRTVEPALAEVEGKKVRSFDRIGKRIVLCLAEDLYLAVHGRFRKPCPVCGAPVQRIVYASSECNYCARCQTGGKLLADRALEEELAAKNRGHGIAERK